MTGIREKRTIEIIIKTVVEVDGTDSMDKVLVCDTSVVVSVDDTMERVRELLERAKENNFTLL